MRDVSILAFERDDGWVKKVLPYFLGTRNPLLLDFVKINGARSVEEALNLLRKDTYDFLLMDSELPYKELLRAVGSKGRSIKIVLAPSGSPFSLERAVSSLGGDGVLCFGDSFLTYLIAQASNGYTYLEFSGLVKEAFMGKYWP